MADLTAAGVTLLDAWTDGGTNGKRYTVLKLSLNLTSAGSGAASNKIPASVLGLSSIVGASTFMKSDGAALVPASPNPSGTELLLGGGASNAPLSQTGIFTGVVTGITV